jgi:DNA-binding response OmpR family regulator
MSRLIPPRNCPQAPSPETKVAIITSLANCETSIADLLWHHGYTVISRRTITGWSGLRDPGLKIAIIVGNDLHWLEAVCAAVRRYAPVLPLIVLGPEDVLVTVRLYEIGVDAYMTEPVPDDELIARIKSLNNIHERSKIVALS